MSRIFQRFLKKQEQTAEPRTKISSINSIVFLNEDSIAFDLGANVGKITQEMVDTGATVYAFEPNPHAFKVLSNRFEGNSKVTCIQKAVLDKESIVPLYFHEQSDQDEVKWSVGSSLLGFKNNVLKSKKVEVETVDLAEFVFSFEKNIDLIKMDIEGAECNVINHLIATGAINKISKLLVETHDHKISELKEKTNSLRTRIRELKLEEKIDLNWI